MFEWALLIGSTRNNEKRFRDAEKIVTEKGFIVFTPVFYDYEEYKLFGDYPNMLDKMCYQKFCMSDILVLVTPEHIGHRTSVRIQQAKECHKKIFIIEGTKLKEFTD